MREVLTQPSDDEEHDSELSPESNSPSLPQSGQYEFTMHASDLLPNMGSALNHPTHSQVHCLCLLYLKNVDPVVKMLHGPSLRRYFIEGSGELDCSPGPKGLDALRFAIYYTTTTSLNPEECLLHLGEEKAALLSRYRSGTELALARADVINTEEMSTLQALVLYLVSQTPSLPLSGIFGRF
jgi:hypothetical protein